MTLIPLSWPVVCYGDPYPKRVSTKDRPSSHRRNPATFIVPSLYPNWTLHWSGSPLGLDQTQLEFRGKSVWAETGIIGFPHFKSWNLPVSIETATFGGSKKGHEGNPEETHCSGHTFLFSLNGPQGLCLMRASLSSIGYALYNQ